MELDFSDTRQKYCDFNPRNCVVKSIFVTLFEDGYLIFILFSFVAFLQISFFSHFRLN